MSIKISNQEFANAIFRDIEVGSFVWAMSFDITVEEAKEDKNKGVWSGKPGKGNTLPRMSENGNTYFVISSLKPVNGTPKRKKENFSALHVIVLDDIGTKAHLPDGIEPSYLLETSDGNFQAGLILETPLTDLAKADEMYKQLGQFGFNDQGLGGPSTRYVRLPVGRNNKAKCGPNGFQHNLTAWNPEKRFSIEQIADMFGLNLTQSLTTTAKRPPKTADAYDQEDQVIIGKILRNTKAKRVWFGDDAGFNSGSDADQYLLNVIAYQTHDLEQIETIYSQSERYERISSDGIRKWKNRPDYRERSIASAFAFADKFPHGDVDGAKEAIEAALKVAKDSDGDFRSLYADNVVQAFAILEQGDLGNYDYFRNLAKKAGASLVSLDKSIKQAAENEKAVAHVDAADAAIAKLGGPGSIIFSMPLGNFWQWRQERGIWVRLNSDEPIKQAIHAVLPNPQINAGTVSSIFQVLKTKVAHDVSFDRPLGNFVINCANGELHLKDVSFDQGLTEGFWELKPHVSEHHHTAVIPVAYSATASSPRFDKFLDEIFEGDADAGSKKRLVWTMMAYSLFPTTELEKFFILYGPGANNGKSTLLSVVEWIAGRENVSALSLKQLGERFAPANLQGKLINLCAEIPMGETLPDEQIKKLVSGDAITAEFKGKNHFEFRSYATLWFATNNLPHSRDVSPATIQKRCILLEFNRSFDGENRDFRLKEKLRDELPGILSYALQLFGGLLSMNREQGHDLLLEEPPSSVEGKAKWLTSSDPVRQFAEDRLVSGKDFFIESKELYPAWTSWRDSNGIKSGISSKQLTDALKRQFGNRIQTGDSVRQHGKRGIQGLAIRCD